VVGLLQWVVPGRGSDPLKPLGHLTARLGDSTNSGMPQFTPVRSVDELDAALRAASRPIMLDF